jgi:hypothetical protein
MKITRSQLRQMIKEAIEVHQVPVDLDTVDSEEAYGIGYVKGAEQDPDSNDDGFLSTSEIVNMTHDIVDDLEPDEDLYDQGEDIEIPGLSAKFAKEAGAKSAALSAATSFNNSLEKSGSGIDDHTLSRVYTALLRMARLSQDRTLSGD